MKSQSGLWAKRGLGPLSATTFAGVASISGSDALRAALILTLTRSPATRFDSGTTVGTPCVQRRNCVFASTANFWSSPWPMSFFRARRLPPFTST